MGTNYYWYAPPCKHCGLANPPMHIGKSSAGWPFSVHVMPAENITCWNDWLKYFEQATGEIRNEYGEVKTVAELNRLVKAKRSQKNEPHVLQAISDYPDFQSADPETGDLLTKGDFL